FKEMAAKLAAIQPPDGLWRPSLLDPDSYPHPETSGSGFFCFALAWGINQGLLAPDVYLPVVKNAWTGLVKAVHPDGKLGSVQPIGADPKQVHADQTEIYGVGAFLLAGSEVYKLALFQQLPKVIVSITNPLAIFRPQETVTLHWNDLQKFLPAISPENVAVFATKNNQFLMTQNLNDPARRQNDLLFQADWAPNETRIFWIAPQLKNFSPPRSDFRTFAMFVPQRKEDFAWENDRIAFRMYGKALEAETVSSGIDVWVKRVAYPVLEKWYQTDDYHVDHGAGLDFYKVGPTRGCGGLAIWKDGKLFGSRNFRRWKIIANGPLRSVFELEYDPWEAGALRIREVKRIALDLGSNLNHIESSFYTDAPASPFEVAIGMVKVQNDGAMTYHLKQGWLGYWQPADPVNGVIGGGIVVPGENLKFLDHDNHGLLVTTAAPGAPLVYYAGAGWSKTKLFPERASWTRYLEEYALRIANPLKITVNLSK
ncbi:DUF4861 family protein, partial [candidate division KSB1 bacterium]|nr:DUF4861 family protein [candidate division KSB1 bacterium]